MRAGPPRAGASPGPPGYLRPNEDQDVAPAPSPPDRDGGPGAGAAEGAPRAQRWIVRSQATRSATGREVSTGWPDGALMATSSPSKNGP